ncbi:MAG: hypothetical protein JSV00_01340, partial [bacterium]
LAVAAWFASRIVLSMVVTHPVPALPQSARMVVPEAALSSQLAAGSDFRVILDRNIFDVRVGSAPPAVPDRSAEDLDNLPETTLPLELIGTVVQVSGKGSFAIIQDTVTREQQIHFVGGEVREGVTVLSVARNRVVLLRQGREEVLEKADEAGSPEPARSRSRLPRPAAAPTPGAGSEAIAVRKVGDSSFILDKREVEGVLQDFNQLLTQIRVVPHFADGKPDGFKVFNIRPGSLFAQLGMVNGDIIKRVNGLDITGPEQALQMFQQLRDESQVTVDLERFRKNLTLNYEIR